MPAVRWTIKITALRGDMRGGSKSVGAEFNDVHEQIAKVREQVIRGELAARIWMLVTQAAMSGTLLGVMAKGFGWIH